MISNVLKMSKCLDFKIANALYFGFQKCFQNNGKIPC